MLNYNQLIIKKHFPLRLIVFCCHAAWLASNNPATSDNVFFTSVKRLSVSRNNPCAWLLFYSVLLKFWETCVHVFNFKIYAADNYKQV